MHSIDKIHGVILAAGLASRMPNKALLPIHNGRIVLESSLDLFASLHGAVYDVTIVVSPNSIIPDVMRTRSSILKSPIRYVIQEQADGVASAVHAAAGAIQGTCGDKMLVTFCDCVYDGCAVDLAAEHVACRQVDDPDKQLDAWQIGEERGYWVSRDRANVTDPRLLGWYLLCLSSAIQGGPHESSVAFLNRIKVPGKVYNTGRIWDVGTVNSYQQYLRSMR